MGFGRVGAPYTCPPFLLLGENMKKAVVDVLIVQFAYGGNGGVASTIPELAQWMVKTVIKMKSDSRIGRIRPIILADTPITMTRNRSIRIAKDEGYDMVLMLDSDNQPDGYVGVDPLAKPFWDVSFDFAYGRLLEGKPTCIAAPYCGPPPHPVERPGVIDGGEVPYLFHWMNNESDVENPAHKLEIMNRNEAAILGGIYPVAALPTGVCLITINCFDGMKVPYFYYEFNEDHSEKQSTEDVVATRNISLHWAISKGWDVCFAACDSWALHHKPKKVGKPKTTPIETLAEKLRKGIEENISVYDRKLNVDFTKDLPSYDGPSYERVITHQEPEDEVRYEPAPETIVAVEEEVIEPPVEKQNGHALKHRIIGGKKIALIPTEISEEAIENIEALTNWLVDKREGPLEVAVAHAGSGQASAAILAQLPEGSHLYALDSLLTYKFSPEPSQQFAKSFQGELESGRVMADLSGRKFPYPEDQQHLDLVFIERAVTAAKIDKFYQHVTPGGLLSGTGYDDKEVKAKVDDFAEENKTKVRFSGDVWAIPK